MADMSSVLIKPPPLFTVQNRLIKKVGSIHQVGNNADDSKVAGDHVVQVITGHCADNKERHHHGVLC